MEKYDGSQDWALLSSERLDPPSGAEVAFNVELMGDAIEET